MRLKSGTRKILAASKIYRKLKRGWKSFRKTIADNLRRGRSAYPNRLGEVRDAYLADSKSIAAGKHKTRYSSDARLKKYKTK